MRRKDSQVNPPPLLVCPATFPSTFQSRSSSLWKAEERDHSSVEVHRSLPEELQIQSSCPDQQHDGGLRVSFLLHKGERITEKRKQQKEWANLSDVDENVDSVLE
jgi:hypothetical protein